MVIMIILNVPLYRTYSYFSDAQRILWDKYKRQKKALHTTKTNEWKHQGRIFLIF